MARFTYKVKDDKNNTQKGIVEAVNIKQAVSLLHEKGFYIIDLKEEFHGLVSMKLFSGKVGFGEIVNFTRQISSMITAGLTLVESLSILKAQNSSASVQKMIAQILEDIQSGGTFTQALVKQKIFPPIYTALTEAGEASGKLDSVLERLADNMDKSREFKNKIRSAMIYPSIIILGMITISIIVMTVVVPKLSSLYKEFNISLPLPTQILIDISTFFVNSWWIILIILISAIVGYINFIRTNLGKHLYSLAMISLPIFGKLIKQSNIIEMIRTLSILVESGVPILSSLEIAKNATRNILFIEAFDMAIKQVEKGGLSSDVFGANTLFPPILTQMVAVGEHTGKLGDVLFRLSNYFEGETDNTLRALTTALEPAIMIILGLGVMFLVIAVLMPIYTLTSHFG